MESQGHRARGRSVAVRSRGRASAAPAAEGVRLPVHAGYDVALALLELRCHVRVDWSMGDGLTMAVFPPWGVNRDRPNAPDVSPELRIRSLRVDVVVPREAPRDETVDNILRELLYGREHLKATAATCEAYTVGLATAERLIAEGFVRAVRVWSSPSELPFSAGVHVYGKAPEIDRLLDFDILGGSNAPSGRGPGEYLVTLGHHPGERFEPLTQAGCVETIVHEARARFEAIVLSKKRR